MREVFFQTSSNLIRLTDDGSRRGLASSRSMATIQQLVETLFRMLHHPRTQFVGRSLLSGQSSALQPFGLLALAQSLPKVGCGAGVGLAILIVKPELLAVPSRDNLVEKFEKGL